MLRALVLSACSLALVAGCSSDGGDDAATSAPPTLGAIDGAADAGTTPAATAAPVDSVDVPVVPVGTDDIPIVPVGTDDIPIVPLDTADVPVVDPPEVSGLDATIAALLPNDVCALAPSEALEAIVGMPLTAPFETDFDDLGAACTYVEDIDGGSSTVAAIELNTFDFAQQIDTASPAVTECTVAGRAAYCQDAFVDESMSVDATVVVALGADDEPAMVVSSSVGLDAAIAIAELALSNLEL